MRNAASGRRVMALALTLGMLAISAAPATANSIPRTGDQLNLFVPPATAPADTAFWVGHGFATLTPELPADVAGGTTLFELYVDGAAVSLRKDAEFFGGASVESVSLGWYHNFDTGLSAGQHQLEGRWYVDDDLFLLITVDVLFE